MKVTKVIMTREQHRFMAQGLLAGQTPGQVCQRGRRLQLQREQVDTVARRLAAAGIGPQARLLTVAQAAEVLDVIPRRVRLLCQEGRLGTQVGGGPWIIEREELAEYIRRNHSSGQAGREAAEEDKLAVAGRYGGVA